jgi:putative phage-type endonuclease
VAKGEKLPEQRTKEWYETRYNLLSASNAWKCLDKQNYKNNIIYEKCEPLNTEKYNYVNINTPFHWGQKYEPVSQMYYEFMYDADIKEYGCIPHSNYNFLGASPDGINVKRNNERYGRLLEIKNIYNREINGIPKKEYWIQTQLQMECCDLDECDFLECLFIEYENEEEFLKDGDFQKSSDGKYKGIIIQYFKDNKPYYEYSPFQSNKEDFDKWYEQTMENNKEISWIKNIYWKLEKVSCVLIQRNKVWFNNVVDELKDLWETIKKERISGHSHRKPIKKVKNNNTTHNNTTHNNTINNDKNEKVIKNSPLIINIDI